MSLALGTALVVFALAADPVKSSGKGASASKAASKAPDAPKADAAPKAEPRPAAKATPAAAAFWPGDGPLAPAAGLPAGGAGISAGRSRDWFGSEAMPIAGSW